MRLAMGMNLQTSIASKGKPGMEAGSGNLCSKLSVNEEYKQALRTTSYLEMFGKVQDQLSKTSLKTSPSHLYDAPQLTESLLEPKQEALIDIMESSVFHKLLLDYFEASLEASSICESLLQAIHQTRINHRKVKKVSKLSKRLHKFNESRIFQELSGYARLENPFSTVGLEHVNEAHVVLFDKLTSKQKKIKRIAKLVRLCKKVGAYSLVIAHSALITAVLVIAIHSIVGVVAAPGFVVLMLSLLKKNFPKRANTMFLDNLCSQLDVAAKGVFILVKEFDTVSGMVSGLRDDIEYRKSAAERCVNNGKIDVFVKEYRLREQRFHKQLQELEEHAYLCFHTINRSRTLVLEEILVAQA